MRSQFLRDMAYLVFMGGEYNLLKFLVSMKPVETVPTFHNAKCDLAD